MMSDSPDETVITFERKSRFKRERLTDISPSTKPWRIKNVWPMQGVCFVVGASGAAKTFFTLDGLLRLSGGDAKIWGRKAKQCGVVMVAAEDPEGCRVRAYGWRWHKHEMGNRPFEMIGRPVDLMDDAAVDELKAELRLAAEEMEQAGTPLGIVAFDTLSCCIAGADENSGVDMSRVLKMLQALAADLALLVVVVAHFGKAGSTAGIRGWSGLTANADGVIEIERDKDDPELRLVRFQKVKNGRDGGKIAFRLEEVDTGLADEDGDPITTCVPVGERVEASRRVKKKKALNPAQQIVFQAIKYVTDHGSTFVPPMTVQGARPNTKAVTVADVRARADSSGLVQEGEKSNTKLVRFNRALEAVCASEYARLEGGIVWLL